MGMLLTQTKISNLSNSYPFALVITPSFAAAGQIFDFNATLPAIMAQLLALTFFLDVTWFGPVRTVLQQRQSKITKALTGQSSSADAIISLQLESDTLLREARSSAANLAITKSSNSAHSEAAL